MARDLEMLTEGSFIEGDAAVAVRVKVWRRAILDDGSGLKVALNVRGECGGARYSTLVRLTPYMARRLAYALLRTAKPRRKHGS